MPRISIILPTHNAAKYLDCAVSSILRQTCADFELLVVDDGSTDETAQIADTWRDRRIRYLRDDVNRGITAALNRAIALASGEYLARMDADEIAEPTRLERQIGRFDADPRLGLLGTRVLLVDADGRPCRRFPGSLDLDRPTCDGAIRHRMMFLPTLAHATAMFRRAALEACGGRYHGVNGYPEDYDLWLRMVQVTQVAILPRRLMRIRVNPEGLQATRRRELLEAHARLAASAVEQFLGRREANLPLILQTLFFSPIAAVDQRVRHAFRAYLALTEDFLLSRSLDPRERAEIRMHAIFMSGAMIRAQPSAASELLRLMRASRSPVRERVA